MMPPVHLSSLFLLTFIVPIRAAQMEFGTPLHFSVPVADCNDLLHPDWQANIDRWRAPVGEPDSQDQRVIVQLIMDEYKPIQLDEKTLISHMRSAVGLASYLPSIDETTWAYAGAQSNEVSNESWNAQEFEGDLDPLQSDKLPGTSFNRNLRSSETNKDGGTLHFYIDKGHLEQVKFQKRKWEDAWFSAVLVCNSDGLRHQHQETHWKLLVYALAATFGACLAFRHVRSGPEIDDTSTTISVDAILVHNEEPIAVTIY